MTDEKEHTYFNDFEWLPRLTVLPWFIWALIAVLAIWATGAAAAPTYRAEAEGTLIVLTDEDCKLPEIANLKKRATWTEKGKTFEGCYGGHPAYPLVLFYFSDKTVVVLPVEAFAKVTGA